MATKRKEITEEIVRLFKEIDGTVSYKSNLFENVFNKCVFMDEIKDFPTVCVWPGAERREYLPSNFQWGYITLNIRIYVGSDDPKKDLENIFEDLEKVLDENNTLRYPDGSEMCTDIRIITISDDEGLFNDQGLGIGEIQAIVQYSV